jgi:hypothetical protein
MRAMLVLQLQGSAAHAFPLRKENLAANGSPSVASIHNSPDSEMLEEAVFKTAAAFAVVLRSG